MDAVERDDPGGEFFLDSVDGLASQHVGMEVDFQLPKERFDSPSPPVEFDDFGGGIGHRIEQRSDQPDRFGPG